MPETTRRPAVRTVLVVGVLIVSALHLGDGAWRSRAHGIADFPIFISEAEAFLDTGVLYPYTDQPAMYAPATAVYKFPPLFATLLLPFAKAPRGPVYFGHWVLQLVCYLGICAWLVVQQRGHPRRRRLAIVTVVLLLNTEPFYETLWRLQLETYVLLAIVAALSALRLSLIHI